MARDWSLRDNYLILLCGLPGCGKSTTARKLTVHLKNYVVIDQNEIRRKHGYKKMPKTFDSVLREIDRLMAQYLNAGRGVIFDSVNRRTARRQQMYGVASCCGARVITLEVICPEDVAKKRISERPDSDGLLSDPNDPSIYNKLKADSDPVEVDFTHPGQDHVSYIQFNTDSNELVKKIVKKGMGRFVNQIKKELRGKDA